MEPSKTASRMSRSIPPNKASTWLFRRTRHLPLRETPPKMAINLGGLVRGESRINVDTGGWSGNPAGELREVGPRQGPGDRNEVVKVFGCQELIESLVVLLATEAPLRVRRVSRQWPPALGPHRTPEDSPGDTGRRCSVRTRVTHVSTLIRSAPVRERAERLSGARSGAPRGLTLSLCHRRGRPMSTHALGIGQRGRGRAILVIVGHLASRPARALVDGASKVAVLVRGPSAVGSCLPGLGNGSGTSARESTIVRRENEREELMAPADTDVQRRRPELGQVVRDAAVEDDLTEAEEVPICDSFRALDCGRDSESVRRRPVRPRTAAWAIPRMQVSEPRVGSSASIEGLDQLSRSC